jgi:hypothetical protein
MTGLWGAIPTNRFANLVPLPRSPARLAEAAPARRQEAPGRAKARDNASRPGEIAHVIDPSDWPGTLAVGLVAARVALAPNLRTCRGKNAEAVDPPRAGRVLVRGRERVPEPREEMSTIVEAERPVLTREHALALLRPMRLIRRFEEKAADLYTVGKISGEP